MIVMRYRVSLPALAAVLIGLVVPGVGAASAPALGSTVVNCIGDVPGPSTPGGQELVSVEFSDRTTGWAAGGGQILHTTDAGAHWAVAYRSAGAYLLQIDTFNDRYAWAVDASQLLRTTDGGQTWHALALRCPSISFVDFFSPRSGVAIAGKTLLRTTDGGRTWDALPAPRKLQSVCFSDAQHGWAGAHGEIYRTVDGAQRWRLNEAGPKVSKQIRSLTEADVQCAGPRAGWAELDVADAAMNQEQHFGYHLSASGSQPIFDEGYFSSGGLPKLPSSPGPEPSTFSAISPTAAAYVDFCGACGDGAAELGIVTDTTHVAASHRVAHLAGAQSAAFLSPTDGWVVGESSLNGHPHWRIEHTTDGGRTWATQYQS
jgi:photosystem II stability/assembly factor-like uncharacterized protein